LSLQIKVKTEISIMPYLTKFNYSEPHLTDKVQYFWDFFRHANERLGRLEDFIFDSPLYRIEFILDQLENYPTRYLQYACNHMDHLIITESSYFSYQDEGKCEISP